ncbi:MAG: NAD(P)H-binding protein, partial [Calditrichaceae bacterium]
MKILLLGATGRTGKRIIEQALQRGHKIAAIVRKPEDIQTYKVDIIQGTPYDYDTVERAIKGCNAVINTLNISRKSDNPWSRLRAPEDLISKSAVNAIKAMEKSGIRRFIALSAIGAGRSRKKIPWILKIVISFSNLKYAFHDHGKQEEILENSAMDYTICRAPFLSDKENDTGAVATPE